VSGNLLNTIFS